MTPFWLLTLIATAAFSSLASALGYAVFQNNLERPISYVVQTKNTTESPQTLGPGQGGYIDYPDKPNAFIQVLTAFTPQGLHHKPLEFVVGQLPNQPRRVHYALVSAKGSAFDAFNRTVLGTMGSVCPSIICPPGVQECGPESDRKKCGINTHIIFAISK